ncbi:uncharacterized protein LOC115783778 [Archocentrus centrarchus]|uniref:uncharacterized protein LOC115783778 n=1 Tax=Archocentrus centrarchus TaxID=63155 RepID=UPI0011E9DEAC|nr:uncharacterized protein LOC115783778 [Archocentrus centrarchus]
MKVHHTLICFFFLSLLDGNDDQRKKHFYKEAGSSLTVGCSFKYSGGIKMFCRGECGGNKILVDTYYDRAQSGRYRIRYVSDVLYVSITQLSSSDSGQYRCYQDGTYSWSFTSSFRDFEITVTDAATTTTTAQSFSSSSGSSTPSFTLTGATEESERAASTDVLLYVGLILAASIILLSVALLIFCKKRSSKANDGPVETAHAAVTEEEADSSKLTYSEVRFFKTSVGSPDSASRSNTNEVIYSAPRARVSSDSTDDPLYSTVA